MTELIFAVLIFAEFFLNNLSLVYKNKFCKVLLFVVIRENIAGLLIAKMNSATFPGNLRNS